MHVAYVFVAVWSIGAFCMGALFAFKPEVPADMYIARMERPETLNRLRKRLAPRSSILVWYRIGGVVFMVAAVVLPVLAITGVLEKGMV